MTDVGENLNEVWKNNTQLLFVLIIYTQFEKEILYSLWSGQVEGESCTRVHVNGILL